MATNNILPFAPTDTGTNLLTQVEYAAAADRTIGNQPGVASSKLVNKAIRQSAFIASQLAQYISDKLNQNVLDDGNTAALLAEFNSAFAPNNSSALENIGFTATVAANALTIALKTQAGSNASATDIAYASFRSSTLTTGLYNRRAITGALSVTVSSGSTLGMSNGVAGYLFIYLIDNAGTPELAIANGAFDEGLLWSTTAEGGAGAADSAHVLYSTTARSNVPVRLIGRILISQATAGTWASAPTSLSLPPFNDPLPLGVGLMTAFTSSGSYTTPTDSTVDTIYEYTVVGGGGGGGNANSPSQTAGGGGGAGGTAKGTFRGIAPGTILTVTVGSGGAATVAGTASSLSGTGLTTITANGGGQGGSNSNASGGGGGGTATGGTINLTGQAGTYGWANSTSPLTYQGGHGGNSIFPGGGSGAGTNFGGGTAAVNYGNGGGGGVGGGIGAAGSSGIVIITRLTA